MWQFVMNNGWDVYVQMLGICTSINFEETLPRAETSRLKGSRQLRARCRVFLCSIQLHPIFRMAAPAANPNVMAFQMSIA